MTTQSKCAKCSERIPDECALAGLVPCVPCIPRLTQDQADLLTGPRAAQKDRFTPTWSLWCELEELEPGSSPPIQTARFIAYLQSSEVHRRAAKDIPNAICPMPYGGPRIVDHLAWNAWVQADLAIAIQAKRAQ